MRFSGLSPDGALVGVVQVAIKRGTMLPTYPSVPMQEAVDVVHLPAVGELLLAELRAVAADMALAATPGEPFVRAVAPAAPAVVPALRRPPAHASAPGRYLPQHLLYFRPEPHGQALTPKRLREKSSAQRRGSRAAISRRVHPACWAPLLYCC